MFTVSVRHGTNPPQRKPKLAWCDHDYSFLFFSGADDLTISGVDDLAFSGADDLTISGIDDLALSGADHLTISGA